MGALVVRSFDCECETCFQSELLATIDTFVSIRKDGFSVDGGHDVVVWKDDLVVWCCFNQTKIIVW